MLIRVAMTAAIIWRSLHRIEKRYEQDVGSKHSLELSHRPLRRQATKAAPDADIARAAINAPVSPSHPSWLVPPVGGSAAGLGPRVGVPIRPVPAPAPAGVVAPVVVPPVGAGVGVGVGVVLGVAVGLGVSACSATQGVPSPT